MRALLRFSLRRREMSFSAITLMTVTNVFADIALKILISKRASPCLSREIYERKFSHPPTNFCVRPWSSCSVFKSLVGGGQPYITFLGPIPRLPHNSGTYAVKRFS